MRKRILVVDDEEGIRFILEKAFAKEGYEVTSAESAEKALEILHEEIFPVQFIDLQLPGMNGIELCKKIRKDNPTSILIAITGYASVFQIVEARDAGFDDYFLKPFQVNDLVSAVKEAFKRLDRWRKKM